MRSAWLVLLLCVMPTNAEDSLSAAEQLLAERKPNEAVAMLDRLKLHADSPKLNGLLSRAYEQMGAPYIAFLKFGQVGADKEVQAQFARFLFSQLLNAEAETELSKAIEADPQDASLRSMRGYLYFLDGRYSAAADDFKRSNGGSPTPELAGEIARAAELSKERAAHQEAPQRDYFEQGRKLLDVESSTADARPRAEGALRAFRAASSRDEAFSGAFLFSGIALLEMGEPEEAARTLQRISGPAEGACDAALYLALALRRAGHPEQARQALSEAVERLRLETDVPLRVSLYGLDRSRRGIRGWALDEALADLGALPRVSAPDQVYEALGRSFLKNGVADDALRSAVRGEFWNPKNGRVLILKGEALEKVGNDSQALQVYEGAQLRQLQFQEAYDHANTLIWAELAKTKPDDANLRLAAAEALLKSGRIERANAEFEKALKLNPALSYAQKRFESALESSRRPVLTVAPRNPYLKAPPGSSEAALEQGIEDYEAGDPKKAASEFASAVSSGARTADAYYLLGKAQIESGSFAEGIASLEESVRSSSGTAEMRWWLETARKTHSIEGMSDAAVERIMPTEVFFHRTEFEAALATAERLSSAWLAKAPNDPKALAGLGYALFRKSLQQSSGDEFARSKNLLNRAVQADPESAKAHFFLGLTGDFLALQWLVVGAGANMGGCDRPDDSIREYRKAIELDPDLADVHVALGDLLGAGDCNSPSDMQGDPDAALASYKAAVAAKPRNGKAFRRLAGTLRAKGSKDAAVNILKQGLMAAPEDAVTLNDLGAALLSLGRIGEAKREFKEAIRLVEDYAAPHNGLGEVLLREGRTDDAILEFRRAAKLDPFYGNPANLNLGLALKKKGQLKEALESLRTYKQGWLDCENCGEQTGKAQNAIDEIEAGLEKGAPSKKQEEKQDQ